MYCYLNTIYFSENHFQVTLCFSFFPANSNIEKTYHKMGESPFKKRDIKLCMQVILLAFYD